MSSPAIPNCHLPIRKALWRSNAARTATFTVVGIGVYPGPWVALVERVASTLFL